MLLAEPYDPVIILAPERSCGSLVSAMLGQHPQMYALSETELFARNEMGEWIRDFRGEHSHGLVRAVAEVVFGQQSKQTIERARTWIRHRASRGTIDIFSELQLILHPLLIVEGSPRITSLPEHMCRVRRLFPEAKFLHLVIHPITYATILLQYFQECLGQSPVRTSRAVWAPESIFFHLQDADAGPAELDLYRPWYERHLRILKFLSTISASRQRLLRVEDLLANPASCLREIVKWLKLRDSPVITAGMLRPELWPFAHIGPAPARWGADSDFLKDPRLRLPHGASDGNETAFRELQQTGLRGEVKQLGRQFGYEI